MSIANLFLQHPKVREFKKEFEALVEQANVERASGLWIQFTKENPGLAEFIEAYIFKSSEELAQVINKYTGIRFDEKGVQFLGELQQKLKEKRFKR